MHFKLTSCRKPQDSTSLSLLFKPTANKSSLHSKVKLLWMKNSKKHCTQFPTIKCLNLGKRGLIPLWNPYHLGLKILSKESSFSRPQSTKNQKCIGFRPFSSLKDSWHLSFKYMPENSKCQSTLWALRIQSNRAYSKTVLMAPQLKAVWFMVFTLRPAASISSLQLSRNQLQMLLIQRSL